MSVEQHGMNQFDSSRALVDSQHYGNGSNTPIADKEWQAAPPKKNKWLWIGLPIGILVVIGAVVGGAVGGTVGKKHSGGDNKSAGSNSEAPYASDSVPPPEATTVPVQKSNGGNGTQVTTDLGLKFTYINEFGGEWAMDPSNPYGVSGKAQSWSPRITEEWVWGKDIIRGVNLGGWLLTEPFIVPALYEKYHNATPKPIDEYTLSQAMGANLAKDMEEHYRTFITEKDFAEIAAAGLNWVRIAIGYWAIETEEGEPYLKGVSWQYFLKAVHWGRKYGIRILLDFHGLPGSQNGWNHSGKNGQQGWMMGTMGIANAQRSLNHLRSMVQYISQPGVKEVVPMLGLVNELLMSQMGQPAAGSFYAEAYKYVRDITGYGAGNGPLLFIHDGFLNIKEWDGFLSGADRLGIDQHPYLAFGEFGLKGTLKEALPNACGMGGGLNDTQMGWGITISGEWSLGINDCGFWLTGVDSQSAYENSGKSCTPQIDWRTYTPEFKTDMMNYAIAQMDAYQHWFFWTWHIGNSTTLGYSGNPMWDYKLGLEQGWIPKDPRVANGYCQAHSLCPGCAQFGGTFPASATGGVPNPTIAAAQLASYGAFPPATLTGIAAAQMTLLPTLTPTGTPITLPTLSATGYAAGTTGWAFPNDKAGAFTKVAGVDYPPWYDAPSVPGGAASTSAAAAAAPAAATTAPPAARRQVEILS